MCSYFHVQLLSGAMQFCAGHLQFFAGPVQQSAGAMVWAYLGAGIGFCPGVPMYDPTVALALAAAVGRQTVILAWTGLLPRGVKV